MKPVISAVDNKVGAMCAGCVTSRASLSPRCEQHVVHPSFTDVTPLSFSPSLSPDSSCYLGHSGHCDDDLRRWIPQPLSHRHYVCCGLCIDVRALQGIRSHLLLLQIPQMSFCWTHVSQTVHLTGLTLYMCVVNGQRKCSSLQSLVHFDLNMWSIPF